MYNQRLDRLTDYPFQRLRALLQDVAPASDRSPISLHIGEPHHTPPAFVSTILSEHAAGWGRYPPINGTSDLRVAIAEWLVRRYTLPAAMIDPDRHVQPVAGSREALFMAALAAVPSDGHEQPAVLLPNPMYQAYMGAAVMAGAEPILVPANRDNGFQPDFAALPADLMRRTALVFVNSPSNPQGSIASRDRLRALVALARDYDFTLAVDECYGEIYTAAPPPGALEACADMGGGLENVLVFNSLSKRSSVPGLRSGFVAGDAKLIEVFRRLRNYGGATIPLPIMAASAALWRDEEHVAASRSLYSQKFDTALALLDGRWEATRPGGAFFLWLDVGDGEQAAKRLWADTAVRVLPGAYLANPTPDGNPGAPYIRLALVDDQQTTRAAFERIVETLPHAIP